MIYTGNYDNCKEGNTISISGDKGRSVGYNGRSFGLLAPKLSFWEKWHDNIGKISEQENNDFYIIEYYKHVLANLDAREIYNQLDESILLCYEEPLEFCHRYIVAAWIESELGIWVIEVATKGIYPIGIKQNDNVREDYKRLILTQK